MRPAEPPTLSELAGRLVGGIAAAASPEPRYLDLIMPAQDSPQPTPELRAGERFEFILRPGFLQSPQWIYETWVLSSFEIQLSGKMVAEDGELEGALVLPVVLALRHNNQARWSTDLGLQLVPTPGNPREFTFATGVFVDLQNPLHYQGGADLAFAVTGIVPHFKP
jgi:hypothetical protein